MAEFDEKGKNFNEIEIPLLKTKSPRDILQRVISDGRLPIKFEEEDEEEEEEIELSLGLSLNGRFGVDPNRPIKVIRTSSISDFMMMTEGNGSTAAVARVAPVSAYAPLMRTCSLPSVIEEEWRKRKELQSQRRMAAKRKRSEKMKNSRMRLDRSNSEQHNCRDSVTITAGKDEVLRSMGSQGSGSGSSGTSGLESLSLQGMKQKYNDGNNPTTIQSKNGRTSVGSNEIPTNDATSPAMNPSRKTANKEQGMNGVAVQNVMLDMPCVSTRGEGPNGRRIEGFLYRYRKEEEVRIVCVCHGQFLTPAEFVQHAGGGDVAHPLRHIVVNPSSPSL